MVSPIIPACLSLIPTSLFAIAFVAHSFLPYSSLLVDFSHGWHSQADHVLNIHGSTCAMKTENKENSCQELYKILFLGLRPQDAPADKCYYIFFFPLRTPIKQRDIVLIDSTNLVNNRLHQVHASRRQLSTTCSCQEQSPGASPA